MKEQILRLGKDSMIYGVGTMFTRLINLLLLPLFTAYLTPTDYGILALLALLGFVAQPIFSLGLGASMGPCYFEGNCESRKATATGTAFALLLLSASVLLAVAWVLPGPLSLLLFGKTGYSGPVSLFLSAIAVQMLSTPFALRLQFEQRAFLFVLLTAISTVISVALSVVLVVALGWGVHGMIVGQIISAVAHLLLLLFAGGDSAGLRVDWTMGRQLLRLGLPLVPSFAFMFILQQSNRYFLEWFQGLAEAGIYSIGFNCGMIMGLLVGAFTSAWYPYFMSFLDRQEEARILFGRIFTCYVYGFGAVCLLFFLFAKPVLTVMTQSAFHRAYPIVGCAATAQYFTGMFSLLLPGVYFSKEVKYVSVVQGTSACVAVLLNFVAIRWLGLWGAGAALVLGHLAMVTLQQVWNTWRGREYLPVEYEWGRVGRFGALFLAVAILGLSPQRLSLWADLAFATALSVTLLLVLYRMLSRQERLLLRSLVARYRPRILVAEA